MDRIREKVKKILNKDVTSLLNKHKILLVSIAIVVILSCVGLIVSYAFYQVVDTTPVILSTTPQIADLEVRIMAEERDTNGNGLNSYAIYPYIPKAGYKYDAGMSYCTNGSTINYDASTYDASINATGHDVCYLYFKSTASLDITLEVYAENVDSDGVGNGEYTKLETTSLPSIGYELNSSKSYCVYANDESTHVTDTTVSYNSDKQKFTVNASKKGAICRAYMDAMDVDIALKIFVQAKKGSSTYYEVDKIPVTSFYALNTGKSACTGTSTMSIKNQKVVIAATNRTNCVAYLDVSSGPFIESMRVTNSGTSATITLGNSNLGTTPSTYYYSSDGGKNYVTSTSNTYTFASQANPSYAYKAYSADASGNTSRVFETSTYGYYGLVDYSNQIQTKTITESGYYKLETWGAQGGGDTKYVGGYGGYSVGYIYLSPNSTLYLAIGGAGGYCTGSSCTSVGGYNGGGNCKAYTDSTSTCGAGGGATHIATIPGVLASLENNKDSILIVSGAGGGGNYCNDWNYASGGMGGGFTGGSAIDLGAPDFSANGGLDTKGGTQDGGWKFGLGRGSEGANFVGGGGGYYGGNSTFINGSGGGSGYIGNPLLTNKSMYCYNCTTSNLETTKTISTTCHSSNATENCAKEGNGYAIITYIGSDLS